MTFFADHRGTTLVSAPWVLPITTPPIRHGAVAIHEGIIISCGPEAEITASFPDARSAALEGCLLPCLINCHTHLELSHLHQTEPPDPHQPICAWVDTLLGARCHEDQSEVLSARQSVMADQYEQGVGLLVDIGNQQSNSSPVVSGVTPERLFLQEYLAPTRQRQQQLVESVNKLYSDESSTAHGVYSTGPHALCLLKARARDLAQLFSIHCAESEDELLFVQKQGGCFRRFIEEHGGWDDDFWAHPFKEGGVVNYLDSLGLLDSATLLVHCVHIDEQEMTLIRERGARVCLCPGSNEFLRVGAPKVDKMVEVGLQPCLGTDSLASNKSLDLWREMAILRRCSSSLSGETILKMATSWAAAALGVQDRLGSIEAGREARLINVHDENIDRCATGKDLLEQLTAGGRPDTVQMMEEGGATGD